MIDRQTAEHFADDWIAAWNAHDLDRILAHYAEDVTFSSPIIVEMLGIADGRLVGKAALRDYWARALARLPELRFTLTEVLRGADSVTLLYLGPKGLAAEWFRFGADGAVREAAAHYL